ncbi:hypothetical protein CW731_11260 [Polaribacter sp. ALD11]|uniref:outer membrane beta-barrel protein n=1 Tax=Polaribacter sp. ALD11 TaxID=2058137 RepID=UPI000C3152C3|nr:outer membrane beta-barrel protein [Polaribacter sp. ALD11]AUC85830.1 hypothetical protein CW731_11260 [Polaribacter sp. ALD11]
MENKKIDRLFQEKLKNLEATPTNRVWNNIEANLKNKKRRVLPIWWFSSGIAAILVVGLLLYPFSKTVIDDVKKQPIIIAAPERSLEDFNTIKTDTFNTKSEEKTIIVEENKANKKSIEKTTILVAEKSQRNIEKGNEYSVRKKAMKKIFLTDNKINRTIDSFQNKTIIVQENIEKKESISSENSADMTNSIYKDKKEIKNVKKEVIIAFKKDKEEKKININKLWTISPVVAVLNSNSFSNTSPLNKNLENSTRGDNSYSYGVQIGYQLNNKWSIQSGIHLQEIQFSNNKIAVASSSSSVSSVIFNSGDNYSLNNTSSESFNSNTIPLNAVSLDGNLAQKYGYIEIPIELKYSLLENSNLKTQIVIGFSSLFLNKNTVHINAGTLSRSGKANNLNNLNFSGNLGLDFNYKLDKNWALNLNPMFKTQLNTFDNNANGFKPYFIGIYTGINYQF